MKNWFDYPKKTPEKWDPAPYWNTNSSSGSLLSYILDFSPFTLEHVQYVSWWYQKELLKQFIFKRLFFKKKQLNKKYFLSN